VVYVPRDITDEALLETIRSWIGLLVEKRYDDFVASLGYVMVDCDPYGDLIPEDLNKYRSPLFPGMEQFAVTDWKTAKGGNPNPVHEVVWFEPNEPNLVGAVTFHLPLNGKWSDLSADFVLFERGNPEGFQLMLEEIT